MRGRASFLQFRENGLYVVPTVLQHLVADLPALTVPNLVLGEKDFESGYPLVVLMTLPGLFLEKEAENADGAADAEEDVVMKLHDFIRAVCPNHSANRPHRWRIDRRKPIHRRIQQAL